MELFFQEKISLRGKVEITDSEQNVVYTGKNSFFFAKTYLMDKDGKKVASIGEYGSGIFNRFIIKVNGKKVAKLKRKLSVINQSFRVKKLDWDVKGDLIAREYTVYNGEEKIASIKRSKLVSLLEGYTVDVEKDENAVTVLCVALVLNNILKAKKSKAANKLLHK